MENLSDCPVCKIYRIVQLSKIFFSRSLALILHHIISYHVMDALIAAWCSSTPRWNRCARNRNVRRLRLLSRLFLEWQRPKRQPQFWWSCWAVLEQGTFSEYCFLGCYLATVFNSFIFSFEKNLMIIIMPSTLINVGFSVKKKNPRKLPGKLEFVKYDPRVRRHVLFTETKLK